jgi:predicted secreted protein
MASRAGLDDSAMQRQDALARTAAEIVSNSREVVPVQTVDATPIESVHSIMILRQDLPAGAIFN